MEQYSVPVERGLVARIVSEESYLTYSIVLGRLLMTGN
jgi:hypothetical protein